MEWADSNVTLLAIALLNFFTAIMAWQARQQSKSNNAVITLLEKNTNSIKDALVKRTGEAAFAAGETKARVAGEAKAEALLKDKQI